MSRSAILLYLRAIFSLQRSLKHPCKIGVRNNPSGMRNNPSGMNLVYSDQVSLIIHIPISIYISCIFNFLPLPVLFGDPIVLAFTD